MYILKLSHYNSIVCWGVKTPHFKINPSILSNPPSPPPLISENSRTYRIITTAITTFNTIKTITMPIISLHKKWSLLVTFTEEILNGKLHFLFKQFICSIMRNLQKNPNTIWQPAISPILDNQPHFALPPPFLAKIVLVPLLLVLNVFHTLVFLLLTLSR